VHAILMNAVAAVAEGMPLTSLALYWNEVAPQALAVGVNLNAPFDSEFAPPSTAEIAPSEGTVSDAASTVAVAVSPASASSSLHRSPFELVQPVPAGVPIGGEASTAKAVSSVAW